jgi:hypothetical protein
MEWEQLLAQAGLAFLKEGISFIFTGIKDKKAAQKATEDAEMQAKAAASQAEREAHPSPALPRLDKPATLFWLGNDLMWVQDMMHRGALPERVLQGITHVIRYANDLGFQQGSFPLTQLSLATVILESLSGFNPTTERDMDFLRGHYEEVSKYVQSVKWFIDAVATQQQPGFQKLRAT